MLASTLVDRTSVTVKLVVTIESQPPELVKVTGYCPAVVTEEPSGSVKLWPWQMLASTLVDRTSVTVKLVVTIESQPPELVSVTGYCPEAVTVEPSGSVKVWPWQMLASTLVVRTSVTVKLVVTIESQPPELVKVTGYWPAVVTEDPSGRVKL